jgi:hypothetical protein
MPAAGAHCRSPGPDRERVPGWPCEGTRRVSGEGRGGAGRLGGADFEGRGHAGKSGGIRGNCSGRLTAYRLPQVRDRCSGSGQHGARDRVLRHPGPVCCLRWYRATGRAALGWSEIQAPPEAVAARVVERDAGMAAVARHRKRCWSETRTEDNRAMEQPGRTQYAAHEFVAWSAQQPTGRFELADGVVVAMAPERVLTRQAGGRQRARRGHLRSRPRM